jgi:uncharacterized SAM-binding protein YcdF (DUF218 family)
LKQARETTPTGSNGNRTGKLCAYIVASVLASAWSLVAFRVAILSQIGHYLVAVDPLENADAIEILGGGELSRCKTAAQLFHRGWAPRILVSKAIYPSEKEELLRYGIPTLENHEQCLAILSFHRVPMSAVEVIEGYNQSTQDEAQKIMAYLESGGIKRLIIVTSNFHTRRTRLLFRRILRATDVRVIVQATPPDRLFDPQEWWTRRRDAKTLLWEYQKLLLYALRYW